MRKSGGLSDEQFQVMVDNRFTFHCLQESELASVATGKMKAASLDDEKLVELLQALNLLYRAGEPLVSDFSYDFEYLAELRRRNPDHPFLQKVEPEPAIGVKTVELPSRMLSTEKAYSYEEIERWGKRVEKAAVECGLEPGSLSFKATPKLDGYAAYDDGTTLYTRGDGRRGTDITRAFERGLKVVNGGERGLGPGEIVVSRSYFNEVLSEFFDNSRNFQASLIKEKELEAPARLAIESEQAVFFPFLLLPGWEGGWQELSEGFDGIVDSLWGLLDFDIDGVVFEVMGEQLREYMGATRHHHRWQIAYKRNTETAEVRVLQVIPQTSRSGRVNPVAEVEPVRLSGALIQRATVHHYGMVQQNGVGPGALIRLSRSGEVIPKIEEVIEAAAPELPDTCPSCGTPLVWERDYLLCVNHLGCPAQITYSIVHFFKTLGNVDGFGPSTVQKLFDGGVTAIPEIYSLTEDQFVSLGFGPQQSRNLVDQLLRSRLEPIEDWRFLAAFGVYRMGMGNCERLLEKYTVEEVFALKENDFLEIKGFGEKSGKAIESGFQAIASVFSSLYSLGFNLVATRQVEEGGVTRENQLSGKNIVFTGTMLHGSRDAMQQQARAAGAKVGGSISGRTDFLVCGEKPGTTKLRKAEDLGIKVLSEEEYLLMLS
jgi:DNA ligase (NAD+)